MAQWVNSRRSCGLTVHGVVGYRASLVNEEVDGSSPAKESLADKVIPKFFKFKVNSQTIMFLWLQRPKCGESAGRILLAEVKTREADHVRTRASCTLACIFY